MSENLKSGYYWASFDDGNDWEIAEWDAELKWWTHMGTDVVTDENGGQQIHLDDVLVGPRIEKPGEYVLESLAKERADQ